MDLRKGVSENRYALFVVIKSIVGRYFNVYYIVHPHIKNNSISKEAIQSSIALTNTNCCCKTAIPVVGISGLFFFSEIFSFR